MRHHGSTGILLTVLCAFALAKTPQVLKTELEGILPANKKAKIAYTKGSWDAGAASSIFVVESETGLTRELTPASIFTGSGTRHLEHPNITADGSRVIFWDAKSSNVYTIKWDGTGLQTAFTCNYMSRYWRNPADNSDWVTIENGGVERVNVDKPTQRVTLWNKTGLGRPWYTLSLDGTRMVLNCPHPSVGIAVVPNGSLTKIGFEGCFVNISPDNTYRIMPQNGAGSGQADHTVYVICGPDGKQLQTIKVSDSIIAGLTKIGKWQGGEKEYEDNRWVEPDYTTFFMYSSSVNPFLFCLSTGKYVWFNETGDYGTDGFDMDMRLLDKGASATMNSPTARTTYFTKSDAECRTYSIDGRKARITTQPTAHEIVTRSSRETSARLIVK